MGNLSMESVFWGNTVLDYLILFGIFIIFAILFGLLRKAARFFFRKVSYETTGSVLAAALRFSLKLTPIVLYLPFFIASRYLILPDRLKSLIVAAGAIVVAVCVVRYAVDIIEAAIAKYAIRTGGSPMLSHSIGVVANVFLWIMAALFLLSNFGFNITTLITGVGIGGMALALASQTLLGDLFNYFTIIIDKPFTIGDSVKVGDVTGVVRSVGLKGTRLIASGGEEVVLSNTDMTKGVLYNYNVMDKRRVLARIGIKYDTPPELVKDIPDLIKGIVQSVDDTDFARAHLFEFGDFSLNYEVVYFILSKDYGAYMDRLQKVNFAILDKFAEKGVEFAFPSQSIYMEKR